MQESSWAFWLEDLMDYPIFGYYHGVHLGAWITAVVIMYIATIIFYKRSNKMELILSQKWFYISFATFFGFMGITRIFFIFSYWNETFYNLFLTIGYAFAALALLPLILVLEKWMITQSKKIFSIIGVILTALSFIFIFIPMKSDIVLMIQQIGMPFLGLAFIILYGWMIKNSIGKIRLKALFTLIGMLVFVCGILLDSEAILETLYNKSIIYAIIFGFVSPFVFSLGIIIITMSQKMD